MPNQLIDFRLRQLTNIIVKLFFAQTGYALQQINQTAGWETLDVPCLQFVSPATAFCSLRHLLIYFQSGCFRHVNIFSGAKKNIPNPQTKELG
jgi:hypothetical protein